MNRSSPLALPADPTLALLQAYSLQLLTEKYGQEARQLVKLLLCHYTGFKSYQLISYQHEHIHALVYGQIKEGLEQLLAENPIQYILGSTEFAGLTLMTDPRALIPRPETEELVAWILEDHYAASKEDLSVSLLDIGTGTGAIALALKSSMKEAVIHAIDISEEALSLAMNNSEINKLEINFSKQDVLQGIQGFLPGSLNIIVSNPPYILNAEKGFMKPNVLDHEPHLALFVPDTDAMKFYRPIAEFAGRTLRKKGFLYVELNEAYARETAETAEKAGLVNIIFRNDMQGKIRMMRAERPD